MKKSKIKSVVFAFATPVKNPGSFKKYLINNCEELICFHYFGSYSKSKILCYLEKYSNGNLKEIKQYCFYSGKNIYLRYLFIILIYYYLILVKAPKKSFVIVQDPFFLLFSSLIEKIKNIRFVFWIGDYYPKTNIKRSINRFLKIYSYLCFHYAKKLSYVCYVSPPIRKIFENKFGRIRRLITLGIEKRSQPVINKTNVKNKVLKIGFIAIIRKQQGLDLIIDYIKQKKPKNIVFEIIGEGPDLTHYKHIISNNKLDIFFKFYGFVMDPDTIINNWDIGIALYKNQKNNLSKYCEPTKIKDYLSHGLPVITTTTTYFANEIKKFTAGEVLNKETITELDLAITKLVKNYSLYCKGVQMLQKKYSYQKWYQKKFDFLYNFK